MYGRHCQIVSDNDKIIVSILQIIVFLRTTFSSMQDMKYDLGDAFKKKTADCVALKITMCQPRIGELCKYTQQQVYKTLAYKLTAGSTDFVWHHIRLVSNFGQKFGTRLKKGLSPLVQIIKACF